MDKKTDHSFFETRVRLRMDNLPKKKNIQVLDCFAGDGHIWREVRRRAPGRNIQILGIDRKEQRREDGEALLVGDNLKFLESMDLAGFDIIDLDADGVPYRQLALLFRRGMKKQMLFVTFTRIGFGALPRGMLTALGYPPAMVQKMPSLFWRCGFEKFKQYMANNGVSQIRYYHDYEGRRYYLCFRCDGPT